MKRCFDRNAAWAAWMTLVPLLSWCLALTLFHVGAAPDYAGRVQRAQ